MTRTNGIAGSFRPPLFQTGASGEMIDRNGAMASSFTKLKILAVLLLSRTERFTPQGPARPAGSDWRPRHADGRNALRKNYGRSKVWIGLPHCVHRRSKS